MASDPTKGSPFPGLSFAGELDDLQELGREVTMTEDWLGCFNLPLISLLNINHGGRVSYLRFLPAPDEGIVIMVPCSKDDYGAMELKYSETEKGVLVNLRLAVKRFDLPRQAGRVRVFPVVDRQAQDGKTYLAFDLKNGTTRPARKLKKEPPKTAKPAIVPTHASGTGPQ